MKGRSDPKAAAIEARQEAGVTGDIRKQPLGSYEYFKRTKTHFELIHVDVYLLIVEQERDNWREKSQRRRQWYSPAEAAALVIEPGLAAVLLALEDQMKAPG